MWGLTRVPFKTVGVCRSSCYPYCLDCVNSWISTYMYWSMYAREENLAGGGGAGHVDGTGTTVCTQLCMYRNRPHVLWSEQKQYTWFKYTNHSVRVFMNKTTVLIVTFVGRTNRSRDAKTTWYIHTHVLIFPFLFFFFPLVCHNSWSNQTKQTGSW